MANQAEILQFFEMMLKRAERGEFRFVVVGTVSHAGSEIRTTVAGMATQEEAINVADEILGRVDGSAMHKEEEQDADYKR